MMKTLTIPYEKVSKVETKFKIKLSFQEIGLLTMILSFRKQKDACCMTNEQLGQILRCKKTTVHNMKTKLIKAGLITSTTRGNTSTILRPTKRVITICYPVFISNSPQCSLDDRNTSSKEEENSNTIPLSSLRDDSVWKEGFERAKTIYKDPKKQEEEATRYYEFKTNQTITQ
tara:strand:+ start:737 stop:1255 length:519 start_codon:yes stop_codon:yes gene_type:complete